MNYLAGPLTRAQLPLLQKLVGKQSFQVSDAGRTDYSTSKSAATTETGNSEYQRIKSVVPAGIPECFLPAGLGISQALKAAGIPETEKGEAEGLVYKPALLAQAEVRYSVQKYNLEFNRMFTSLVTEGSRSRLEWEDHVWQSFDRDNLQRSSMPNSQFTLLPVWMSDAKRFNALQSDFTDWVYRSGTIHLKVNQALKIHAEPQVSDAEFRQKCSEASREVIKVEQDKLATSYEKKLDSLSTKIKRQEMEVEEQKSDLSSRRVAEIGTHGELLLSMFAGRKRSISSSLTKRRMTSQSKLDLKQEEEELLVLEKQLDDLEAEYKKALDEVQDKWARETNNIDEVPVKPTKTNIFVDIFSVAWVPYYLVRKGDSVVEVLAAKSQP